MTAGAAMVLLTYTPGPAAEPALYEPWLRSEDNPTFNAIPGIADYSNWKIVAPAGGGLPWTHFDLMQLTVPSQVEPVWFNADLDRFRKGWVARWGYGRSGPSPVNGNGHLCVADERPRAPRRRWAVLELLDSPANDTGERWVVSAALRKHYAMGPAPAGESWLRPVAEFNPLGCAALGLAFHDSRPVAGGWTSRRLLAECIAAPWLDV
jgi:hypothetical protein